MSKANWRTLVLFLLTLGCVGLAGAIFFPFLPSIIWAAAFAVVLRTPYRWLAKRVRPPTLAAAVALVLVVGLVLLPTVILVQQLGGQITRGAATVQSGDVQDWALETLRRFPKIEAAVAQISEAMNLRQAAQSIGSFVAPRLQHFLSASISTVTKIVLMLFTLFFLFRDGDEAGELLREWIPLDDRRTDRLIGRLRDTITATVQGSLTIAAIQGCLGGLMFWILNVPNALIWSVVMAALATIPSLGTFLVWAPVAVYLAVTDHWVKALILFGWGVFAIGTVDNLLYPILVGSKLRLHTVPVLFSVLGGVALFGITGLVLGPLLLAATNELVCMWRTEPMSTTPDVSTERDTAG